MTSRFTPAAQNALKRAQSEASDMGHTYIGTEHLLLGLLFEESSVASDILHKHGLDYRKAKQAVAALCGSGAKTLPPPPNMTPRLKSVIEAAAKEMPGAFGRIGTEQLLSALLSEKNCFAARIIERQKAFGDSLLADISSISELMPIKEERRKLPPTVLKYGQNLNAKALDPVIGREKETEALIEALCRRRKNNPCLIGEPGVGKTAVVEGLARRINDGDVPKFLKNKVIVTLDIASIISGAKYRGEFEERLKTVLLEASEDPDIILFIDELHTIVGTGASEGSIDAANILKPSLARGEIAVIGATTASEYRRFIESDSALERRFLPIYIEEPTKEEAISILLGIKEKYEEHHGIEISDSAVVSAVELSIRYIPSKKLPDKAIDLIDEAASAKRIELEKAGENEVCINGILKGITAEAQDSELSERDLLTSIEETLISRLNEISSASKSDPLLPRDIENAVKKRQGSAHLPAINDLFSLENDLNSAVFGQKSAVKKVANILRAGLIGVNGSVCPIASFLFLGATGVGKTALAESLAEHFYGSKRALIRFDMSEYGEKHSVSRLIGSPPGYIGYRDEGLLTKEVRNSPYSVLLFDEAEKAHPDIFSLLLQILDTGFLTDSQGKRADFRGCVIILTSNLGEGGKSAAGFMRQESGSDLTPEVKDFFRPELIGRLDGVIHFDLLSREAASGIASARLNELKERLMKHGVLLDIQPSVTELVSEKGITGKYGARDIFSFIKNEIEAAVILELPKIKENGTAIEISVENGKISLKTVTKNSISHIM